MPRPKRPKRKQRVDATLKPKDPSLAKLMQSLSREPDPVPPDYRTAVGWAQQWGKSLPHTSGLLRRGVAQGSVEVIQLRTPHCRFAVNHYRIL
jgi:hypothetical protein